MNTIKTANMIKTATKTTMLTSVLALGVVSATASAGNLNFTKADNSAATQLCYTAVQGNRPMMNREIKALGYRKSYVIDNVMCNNMSIGSFVAQYGSETMQKMIPQTTKVRVIDIAAKSSVSGYVEVSK